MKYFNLFNKNKFFLKSKTFSEVLQSNRQIRITEILKKEFSPIFLEVENESFKHNVPKESETHFKITIVSENFVNKTTIDVHRTIYKLLENEMGEKKDNKLHAISINHKTTSQWNKIKSSTPNCLGGDS